MPKVSTKSVPVFLTVGVMSRTSGMHRAVINRLTMQGELEIVGRLFNGHGRPLAPLFRFTGDPGPIASTPAKIV